MRKGIVLIIIIAIIVVAIIVVPPIVGPKVPATLNDSDKGLITFILTLLELFGLIVALFLVSSVFYQLIKYYLPRRFVFEGFSNESDLLTDDLKPIYLSKLAWEELANQSQTLTNQFREYANNSTRNLSLVTDVKEPPTDTLFFIPPRDLIDLSDLIVGPEANILDWVKSSEGKIPKEYGFIMSIISFISNIIPPPVVKIDGYLQRLSSTPVKVGITFEILDIKRQRNVIHTFWHYDKAVSSSAQSSIGCYIKLLRPTMRWLVLECCKQRMIFHVPLENRIPLVKRILKDRENRRQAQILCLLGSQYYASAKEFKAQETFFYQFAADHFYQASNADLNWYLPDLYLANLYIFNMPEKLLKEALSFYDEASDRANRTNESTYTQHRIKIGKALAELASGVKTKDKGLIDMAIKEVEGLKTKIEPASYDHQRAEAEATADCAAYLYNLATWYELAYDKLVDVPNIVPRDEARRYLAYSLARSQSLWDTAENDENFKSMRKEGDLEILKNELDKKLREERELERMAKEHGKKLGEESKLATMTGENFRTQIGLILAKVDQKLGRPGR